MDEEFLTTTPVARILNCSGQSVHIYRNQGRLLPSIRTASGICLYRRSRRCRFCAGTKKSQGTQAAKVSSSRVIPHGIGTVGNFTRDKQMKIVGEW